MTGSISVRGGSYSIAADFARLGAAGQTVRRSARQLESILIRIARTTADPALAAAAALDPIGLFRVVESLSGAGSLTALAIADCEILASGLQLASRCYAEVDHIEDRTAPILESLSQLMPALTGAALTAVPAITRHDPSALMRAAEAFTERDPQLIAPVIDVMTAGQPVPVAAALGSLYDDGAAEVIREPDPPPLAAPRGLADLIGGLNLRNEQTAGGGIAVHIVNTRHSDGTISRAAIVDITGTKDWNLTERHDPNVANPVTNLRAIGNRSSTYERGVLQAMQRSGLGPDEPVMLVGHSQGGIVAARLAVALRDSDQFRITHLVTAGAPIGLLRLPGDVQVLSLENQGDVVPELDAARNRSSANQITVRVDRGGAGLGQRHSLSSAYLPAARDVDASTDLSLRAWASSAQPFLGGDDVHTAAYTVRRH